MTEAFCVDCMDFMKSLPDKAFSLALVDPPYGINADDMNMGTNMTRTKNGYPGVSVAQQVKKGRLNAGAGKLKDRALQNMDCSWDREPPDAEYFKELFRVSENQVIWGGNYFALPPSRGILVWDKDQPWPNFSQAELAWTSFDFPVALFRYSNRGGANEERKIHPCQKPVQLYRWVFKLLVDRKCLEPGARVLDTHLGSGSSRIAAHELGFDFVGCEKDKFYFTEEEKRFEAFDDQQSLFY